MAAKPKSKPPVGRPFKKGQSGNPKGRSKKQLALQELIRNFAEMPWAESEPLAEVLAPITSGNRFVDQAWVLARAGDPGALKLLFEYGYGKAPQRIEIERASDDLTSMTDAELEAIAGDTDEREKHDTAALEH